MTAPWNPARPILCLVTDERIWGRPDGLPVDPPERDERLQALVAAAIEAGIDLVQVREVGLTAKDLWRLVSKCVEMARGTDTMIVVNDRVDVAVAAGAAGVQLRTASFSPAAVRAMVPPGFLIGRSVHAGGEIRSGAADHADYLIAGTMFPSRSKGADAPLLGPDGLAPIVAASPVPVLAIGGITLDTTPVVAASGAAGLAAIDLFGAAWQSEGTLVSLTARLRSSFQVPGGDRPPDSTTDARGRRV